MMTFKERVYKKIKEKDLKPIPQFNKFIDVLNDTIEESKQRAEKNKELIQYWYQIMVVTEHPGLQEFAHEMIIKLATEDKTVEEINQEMHEKYKVKE